ncbi:hypothetical protein K525DRAFT_206483 [Schizophyllum commune Loenen D]|nr:hypothetical protein K525DRAFT_206483 [Schizophyllum commune Loenen D]
MKTKATRLHTSLCATCTAGLYVRTVAIPKCVTSSSHIPSQLERLDLERNIASDAASLDAYDAAILHVRQSLQRLQAERKMIEDSLYSKRAMLGPIRRLPSEILTMIISLAILDTLSCRGDSTCIIQHPVLQVCHRWRDLGIAAPTLWSTITLYPYAYYGWYNALRLCLERSKAHPLNIFLSRESRRPKATKPTRNYLAEFDIDDMNAMHDLVACSARWRCVRLGAFRFPDEIMKRDTPWPLPQLASVYLENETCLAKRPAGFMDGLPQLPHQLFSDAPALKYARIEKHRFQDLRLPWSQLLRLYIDREVVSEHFRDCLAALRQCHSLCSLTLVDGEKVITDADGPVVLPSLRELVLCRGAWSYLPALRAPKLRTVELKDSKYDVIWNGLPGYVKGLKRFVARQGDDCCLSRIKLCVPQYADSSLDWEDILNAYSGTLTHLPLTTGDEATHSLMHTLATRPDLLPHLTSLALPWFKINTEKACAAMEHLIDARATAGGKLEEIEVNLEDGCKDYIVRLRRTDVAIHDFDKSNTRRAFVAEEALSEEERWIMDPASSSG